MHESGVSIRLPIADSLNKPDFKFDMSLNSMAVEMYFMPLGKETTVSIKSDWTNPSFDGAFLPDTHHITDKGFDAEWKIFHLNRNYGQNSEVRQPDCKNLRLVLSCLFLLTIIRKHTALPGYAILLITYRLLFSFY